MYDMLAHRSCEAAEDGLWHHACTPNDADVQLQLNFVWSSKHSKAALALGGGAVSCSGTSNTISGCMPLFLPANNGTCKVSYVAQSRHIWKRLNVHYSKHEENGVDMGRKPPALCGLVISECCVMASCRFLRPFLAAVHTHCLTHHCKQITAILSCSCPVILVCRALMPSYLSR